jgi:hypothetical protein
MFIHSELKQTGRDSLAAIKRLEKAAAIASHTCSRHVTLAAGAHSRLRRAPWGPKVLDSDEESVRLSHAAIACRTFEQHRVAVAELGVLTDDTASWSTLLVTEPTYSK